MIISLKPYPAMKGSGVPWLGEVPEHWEVLPNRAIFDEVKERDHPDADMLSVTITKGVIRQQALLTDSSKKDSSKLDKSDYKFVRRGDIVYNKMRAWQGAVGVSEHEGIVSPAYVVERPREGATSHYLHYLLRTPAFAKEAERWSYGITSDMWSLRPEHFKLIYSCLPTLPEQAAIVRFLDYVDRRIGRYIRAKQKLIKLLEEQKQAIIHRAVTRGLDPSVRLKPSGVEWLGDVPEHWEVRRLKGWCTINRRTLAERTPPDFEFHYLDIGTVGTGVLVREPERVTFGTAPTRARRVVQDGDTIVSTVRTYLKATYFAETAGETLIASTGFAVLSPGPHVVPRFLSYVVQSDNFVARVSADSIGIAYPAIGEGRLGALHVALPPAIEQQRIVEYLQHETRHFAKAIERVRGEIALLREYRTRLIADVVTGKLDVREAAAGLPEEDGEPEPLDENEAEDDTGEADADDTDAVPEEAEA